MEPLHKKKYGVDFRYFRKCHHFENILFEFGVADYSRLPIFILIRFWEIRKFLTNGLRESPCIHMYSRPRILTLYCTLTSIMRRLLFDTS
jgi:hypothetical protein